MPYNPDARKLLWNFEIVKSSVGCLVWSLKIFLGITAEVWEENHINGRFFPTFPFTIGEPQDQKIGKL